MPSFTITGSSTTPQSLNASEIGIVTGTGALTVAGTDAISVSSTEYVRLVVQGSVTAVSTATTESAVFGFSDFLDVYVGPGGLLQALRGNGISVSPENSLVVVNQGTILGSGYGILASNIRPFNATIVNHGLIESGGSAILTGTETGQVYLVNHGTITSHFGTTLDLNGDLGDQGAVRVHNTGVISGANWALRTSYGDDIVSNAGLIIGTVLLGHGANRYEGQFGQVLGTVQGGGNMDTLAGGDQTDVFDGWLGDDLLVGRGGDDSLTGGAGNDYLLGGSGNETHAHLAADGRITIMFCNFDRPALILRIYGHGRAVLPKDEGWGELAEHFQLMPGTRQIFDIAVESVQTSCGWGVPFMDYRDERRTLKKAHAQADPAEWVAKVGQRTQSIDGLPTRPTDRFFEGE